MANYFSRAKGLLKVLGGVPLPNINYWYGPWDSVATAIETISAEVGQIPIGITIAVKINGEIKEYWNPTSKILLESSFILKDLTTSSVIIFGTKDLTEEERKSSSIPEGWSTTLPDVDITYMSIGYMLNGQAIVKDDYYWIPSILIGSTNTINNNATEFVYCLTGSDTTPALYEDSTDENYSTNSYLPTGASWSLTRQSVTSSSPYCWVALRELVDNVWSSFSTPALISNYATSKEANLVLYVYCVTATETTPILSENYLATNYYTSSYVPTSVSGVYWYSYPVSVSETKPYAWWAIRTRTDGTWSKFSTPALYARYAKDGKDGEDGQNGSDYSLITSYYATIYAQGDSVSDLNELTGGSYDFTHKLLTPPTGWFATKAGMTKTVWYSYCTFYSDETNTGWSTPIEVIETAKILSEAASLAKLTYENAVETTTEEVKALLSTNEEELENLKTTVANLPTDSVLTYNLKLNIERAGAIYDYLLMSKEGLITETYASKTIDDLTGELSLVNKKLTFDPETGDESVNAAVMSLANNAIKAAVSSTTDTTGLAAKLVSLEMTDENILAKVAEYLATEAGKETVKAAGLDVNSDKVCLWVALKLTGETSPTLTGASIIAAINDDSSKVSINADKIVLDGDVIANKINAKGINIDNVSYINGWDDILETVKINKQVTRIITVTDEEGNEETKTQYAYYEGDGTTVIWKDSELTADLASEAGLAAKTALVTTYKYTKSDGTTDYTEDPLSIPEGASLVLQSNATVAKLGNTIFYANGDGSLNGNITWTKGGDMSITSGTIGGWTITADGITKTYKSTKVTENLGTDKVSGYLFNQTLLTVDVSGSFISMYNGYQLENGNFLNEVTLILEISPIVGIKIATSGASTEAIGLNIDGSGLLASGNIYWDTDGVISLGKYYETEATDPSYYTTIDNNGLLATRNIEVTGGTIGGWTITSTSITAGDTEQVYLYKYTTGITLNKSGEVILGKTYGDENSGYTGYNGAAVKLSYTGIIVTDAVYDTVSTYPIYINTDGSFGFQGLTGVGVSSSDFINDNKRGAITCSSDFTITSNLYITPSTSKTIEINTKDVDTIISSGFWSNDDPENIATPYTGTAYTGEVYWDSQDNKFYGMGDSGNFDDALVCINGLLCHGV